MIDGNLAEVATNAVQYMVHTSVYVDVDNFSCTTVNKRKCPVATQRRKRRLN